jgi:uncharacterized membrane protein YtjA (UPF0391 family)
MPWLFIFLAAAVVSGVVGFGFAEGTAALVAKLTLLIFGGLAIVMLLAKPSESPDDATPR